MTDYEIMKALECCAYWESDKSCEDCPENTYGFGCGNKLSKHSLDLINRQKAEIERLKQENKEYCEDNRIIAYQRNQRDKEIRALHNQLNGLNFMDKQIKSEAIKEFAERLKRKCLIDRGYNILQDGDIDELVKEMTEVKE